MTISDLYAPVENDHNCECSICLERTEAVRAARAAFQALPIAWPLHQNGKPIDHTLLNEAKRLCEDALK